MVYTASIYNPVTAQTYDITSRLQKVTTGFALDSEVSSLTLSCHNIENVHIFEQLTLKKNGADYFKGVIQNQEDFDHGLKETTFDAADFGWMLQKRIVTERYMSSDSKQGRPDLIIKDLIAKYVPEITTNNVDACFTILDKLDVVYVTADKALSMIMDSLTGWHWYIDSAKDMHLFQNFEVDGPAFQKNVATGKYNFMFNTLNVRYEGYDHANRVWIVGRKQASPTFIHEYFTGDGTKRYFILAYEPNEVEIYVGGVLKDSSLEANDNGNRDFLINKSQQIIYIPPYRSPYTTAANGIDVKYKPTVQFVDKYENYADIQARGVYESVLKNQDIKDKMAARAYGKAEVNRASKLRRIVYFNTQTLVVLGQRCKLTIVEPGQGWDVQGYFLVTNIRHEITDGGAFEYFNVGLEEIV